MAHGDHIFKPERHINPGWGFESLANKSMSHHMLFVRRHTSFVYLEQALLSGAQPLGVPAYTPQQFDTSTGQPMVRFLCFSESLYRVRD